MIVFPEPTAVIPFVLLNVIEPDVGVTVPLVPIILLAEVFARA